MQYINSNVRCTPQAPMTIIICAIMLVCSLSTVELRRTGKDVLGIRRSRGANSTPKYFRELQEADTDILKLHKCTNNENLSERQLEGNLKRRCRVLCELDKNEGCDALLEPCMNLQRSSHVLRTQKMADEVQDTLASPSFLLANPYNKSSLSVTILGTRVVAEHEIARIHVQISSANITFMVFFAVGKRNAEAYPNHQYVEPDLNFIPVLEKSHPGSRVVMLSDEDTPFSPDLKIPIYRVPMDSNRMGRNAYANYYQYLGQKAFLQSLKANSSRQHVVFMDMDVLVLDSILEIFCSEYGYGLTINANNYDPVDIGLQFVHADHYDEGIAFLQDLTDRYLDLIGHPNSFTTGQVVMRNTLEMGHMDVMIPKIATAARKNNMHCKMVQGGKHKICYFPCLRYNFWEDCTAELGVLPTQEPEVYRQFGVKILQFVAWRKPGLEVVAKAFLQDGLEAAYKAFAELPHTEEGYKKRFAFNTNVTKVCYKDDKGCNGIRMEDEAFVFSKPPPE